jgi:hypothetical protein
MSAINMARAEISDGRDGPVDRTGFALANKTQSVAAENDIGALAERYRDLRLRIVRSAHRQVGALHHLANFRRTHEELQNSFFALERAMPHGFRASAPIFSSESAGEAAVMGWGNTGLSQILPIASEGLSAITLELAKLPPEGSGTTLHAYLVGLEDHWVIDSWTMSVDRLAVGPVVLALSRSVVGASRTLDLMLELEGPDPVSLSIAIGDRQPLPQFQIRRSASGAPGWPNMLAMQLWAGAPGDAAAKVIEADPRASENETRLSPTLLRECAHANGHEVRFDFKPVSYVAHRIAVACHPPKHGITIAAVPLPAATVLGVAADVDLGNPKSSPVRFAFALAEDLSRAQHLFAGETANPGEAFSGWTEATFAAPSALHARPAEPSAKSRLYLATGMATEGDNAFAWARFRNLRITTGRAGQDNAGSLR